MYVTKKCWNSQDRVLEYQTIGSAWHMTHQLHHNTNCFIWFIMYYVFKLALPLFQNLCIKSEHALWPNMGHSLNISLKPWVYHWRKYCLAPGSSSEGYKSGAHCRNLVFKFSTFKYVVSKFIFLCLSPNYFTFCPPSSPFQPLLYLVPFVLASCDSQHMFESMASTVDPDAHQHQGALQSTMQSFIAVMRSDHHDPARYVDYIKDIKFLVDD